MTDRNGCGKLESLWSQQRGKSKPPRANPAHGAPSRSLVVCTRIVHKPGLIVDVKLGRVAHWNASRISLGGKPRAEYATALISRGVMRRGSGCHTLCFPRVRVFLRCATSSGGTTGTAIFTSWQRSGLELAVVGSSRRSASTRPRAREGTRRRAGRGLQRE